MKAFCSILNMFNKERVGCMSQKLKVAVYRMDASLAFYYLAFACYFVKCFLEVTMFNDVLGLPMHYFGRILEGFAFLFLVVKFLTQHASMRAWVVSLLAIGIGLFSWWQSGEGWFLWFVLFVVCSHKVEIKKLAYIVLVLAVPLLLLTCVCGMTGVIENKIAFRNSSPRQALGFVHPNFFGMYLMLISVAFSTIRFGRCPLPDVVFVIVACLLVGLLSSSRSSIILMIVQAFIVCAFYFIKNERTRAIFLKILFLMIVAVIAASYALMISFDSSNPIHAALNSLLSNRLSLAHAYCQMQPITLFGSDYSQFESIYSDDGISYSFVVDNTYCHLLLRFGLLPTIMFILGLLVVFAKLVKQNAWDALAFGLFAMAIFGFGETYGARIEFNYFLTALGTELIFFGNRAFGATTKPKHRRVSAARPIDGKRL